MANNEYPTPPRIPANADVNATVRWARALTGWGANVMRGRTNNVGDVTLSVSTAASVVTDVRVNINSAITLIPTTANAANDMTSGGVWASTVRNGTFTITHPSDGDTDRTFKYVITG